MKTSLFVAFLFAAATFLTGFQAYADPVLTSDKLDYAPGETATFTGSGFQPGENVELVVVHADTIESTGEDHGRWVVAADDQGSFVTTWHVCTDDCAGSTLRATADGVASGLHAEVVFTDAPGAAFVTVTANSSCALGGSFRITYKPPTGNDITTTSTTPQTFDVKTNTSFTVTLIQASVNGTTYTGPATINGTSGADNSTTTVTLTYSDNVNPTISAPPAVSVNTGAAATICGAVVSNATLGTATASDNCGTPTITRTGVPAGNVFPVGTTVVTYTATDGGGRTASATQNVTVTDTTPPVVTLNGSANMTVECHSTFTNPGATASDLCAGNLTASILVTGSVNANVPGNYTLTYSVNDGHGNTASAQRQVAVVDTTAPTLTLTGLASMTVECHAVFTDPGATASDACAGNLSAQIQVSGSVNANLPGSYTLTYSVSDGVNTKSTQRTVNVVDTTAPSLSLNGVSSMTVECHSTFTDPGASASDACAGNLSAQVQVSGSVNANLPGSYTLTYSVTDGFNTSSIQRTVNVVDTTPPSLALSGASPMTVECHSAFSDPGATASDACAGDLTSSIQVSGSVDANTPGNYTLTYSVSDGFNTSSTQRTVNVVDTTPPSLALSGASPMTVECHSAFSDPGATASDACAGDLTSSIQVSGSVDANTPGNYTLTYSVSDGFNTSSTQRTVNVVDTTPPSLALSGASTMTVECHSAFSDPGATASDACAGDLTSSIQVSGSVDANTPGNYTLTYSVSDGFNTSSTQRTVNVVDTTPPNLALSGASPMTVECHSAFSDPGATASDACAGDLTSSIQVSGSVDANTPGNYTLTYSVSDGFNTSSTQRTVNVVDTTPPSLALSGASPMTVECHSAFSDPGATASDACAGDLTSSIQVSGSVDANTPGNYTLTYSVSDGFNTSSTQRTVNVVDTTPPSLALSGASPMTVECHSAFSDPGATASDACAGDLTSSIQVSGSVDANTPGNYTLTYSVSDGFNTSSTQRTVNVVDTTPPSLALSGASTMTVECHSAFSDPGATASDACAGDLTSSIQVSGSVDANTPGNYTLTYSVSDGFNTSSTQRTVNVVDTTPPSLALSGASPMTVECHSAFSDPGATASDACAGDLTSSIQVSGSVDANTPGNYTLTYSVSDGFNTSSTQRTVNVVDTTPPSLALSGASTMTVECHSAFSDPGATASDACAGDLTSSIQVSGSVDANTPGNYTLTYSVSDGFNTSSTQRTVNVVDTTPPNLALSGASPMTVECHSAFSDPGATASDACAGDLTSSIQVSGSVDANTPGNYTLTYSVSDGFNTSSTQRTVNVVDTTPPSLALSGASPMTVECHSAFSDPGATASDACAGDLTSSIQVSGSVDANTPGNYTLTYSVSDGFNTSSTQRTVNVVDTTPPSLALSGASPMTVECHSAFSDPGATASDACAGDLTSSIQVSGSVDANTPGNYTLTYSVSDGFNTSSTQRTVNVVDTTPPSLALSGASTMTVECHSAFSDPGATASDACAGDLTSSIQVSGSVDANTPGNYTLTYSVSDGFNTSSTQRTVNVVDTTPPSLALSGASPMTVECHSAFSDPGATASDACAGDLTSSIQVSGSVDANTPGNYTLTYSVSDGFNTSSSQRTVNVVDTTPPNLALSGASPMTVECHSAFSDPGATASDVCAGDLTSSIQVSGSVNANAPGNYTLTYSVSDGVNTSSIQRTVQVVDTTAPALTIPGAVHLATAPGATTCGLVIPDATLGTASANDACAGSLTVQRTGVPAGNLFPVGTTTLNYQVVDGSGNQAAGTQQVVVTDGTPPSLTVPPAVSTVTGSGATSCGKVVPESALGQAQAQDLCSSVTIVRSGVPAGNVFPVGTTVLSFVATDGNGNVTTGTQNVTVVDNTPPVLGSMSNVIQLPDLGTCSGRVNFTPSATDNCSNVTVTTVPASGYAFPQGTTQVTCTAMDAAGNKTVSTFSVTIQNPAPVATITGPASGAIYPIGTAVAFTGSFTDNSGDVHTAQWKFDAVVSPGTVNETQKTVSGSYTFTAPGIYFVQLTVTDQCGGAGTATKVGAFDAMVVIYDPNGGFVTGGGFINSAVGSYAANPSLAGRANFGFVSKYGKGASAPDGETEFQFQLGNLNFHSTSYDWLVVGGAKGQYKGSGTVNGAAGYGFLLSAVDGQVQGGGGTDKFRMKIINKTTGGVVYDNQMGAPDTTTAATVIAGGSIVVHSNTKTGNAGASMEMGIIAPTGFLLAQNTPNPFRGATQVRFSLPEASRVDLTIYDITGREVTKLAEGDWTAGEHTVAWSGRTRDGNTAPGGVYFVRIVAQPEHKSAFTAMRKMLLLSN